MFISKNSAIALPLLLSAFVPVIPAIAHDGPHADDHAPAGVMTDHVHKKGEFMIGLRLSREESGGTNQRGTDDVNSADIVAAGYSSATQSMTMDMAMLDIMYAPTDNLTLMVMPQYMRMKMDMVGLPGAVASSHDGHAEHVMAPGEVHSHTVEGPGDTVVSALYGLKNKPGLKAHVALGVSVPTGDVGRTNADGSFVHYGMQPGSGTWDILPSITLRGGAGKTKWGTQASYVWRTSKHNDSGFAFGDRFATTGWVSHALVHAFSMSARAAFVSEGKVEGHYNAGHNHAAPSDRQENYGGKRVEIGMGFNAVVQSGGLKGLRLAAEAIVPVWQDVNGIQAPKQSGLQISLSKAF